MNLATALAIITAAGAYLAYDNLHRRRRRAHARYRHPTSTHVRVIGVVPRLYDQDEPDTKGQ